MSHKDTQQKHLQGKKMVQDGETQKKQELIKVQVDYNENKEGKIYLILVRKKQHDQNISYANIFQVTYESPNSQYEFKWIDFPAIAL